MLSFRNTSALRSALFFLNSCWKHDIYLRMYVSIIIVDPAADIIINNFTISVMTFLYFLSFNNNAVWSYKQACLNVS